MIEHLVLFGWLLLVGATTYWLAETKLAKSFLQHENQQMSRIERLIYRAMVPASVVTLLIAGVFRLTSEVLQGLGWSWMAGMLSANILPTSMAFFGAAILRLGIYWGLEQGKFKAKLALILHVGTLLAYVGAATLIPAQVARSAIVPLVALHFFGDFIFQSDGMAGDKRTTWEASHVHAGAYTASFILAEGMGLIHLPWWAFWFIFLTHALIDPQKARWQVINRIWMDQGLHLIVLLLVAYTPVLWWLVALAVLAAGFIWSWNAREGAAKKEISLISTAKGYQVYLNGHPIVDRGPEGAQIGDQLIRPAAAWELLEDGTRISVRRGVIFIETSPSE